MAAVTFVACGPKADDKMGTTENPEKPALQTHTHADGTVHAGDSHGTETEPAKDAEPGPAAKPLEKGNPVAELTGNDKADHDKIKIEILKPGKGDFVRNGDTCYMEYTGMRTDGFVFDSNANGKREPFKFVLGTGSVIRGWDLGVLGMKPGEERKLTIPAVLGYGDQGAGKDIPGGATLIFTIKLLDILKPDDVAIFDFLAQSPGSGPKAKAGDVVRFNLEVNMLNGTQVFSTDADKKPITVTLGATNTGYSTGLMAALEGLQAGSKCEVRMPPAINSGLESKGTQEQLLKYSIKVLSVGNK